MCGYIHTDQEMILHHTYMWIGDKLTSNDFRCWCQNTATCCVRETITEILCHTHGQHIVHINVIIRAARPPSTSWVTTVLPLLVGDLRATPAGRPSPRCWASQPPPACTLYVIPGVVHCRDRSPSSRQRTTPAYQVVQAAGWWRETRFIDNPADLIHRKIIVKPVWRSVIIRASHTGRNGTVPLVFWYRKGTVGRFMSVLVFVHDILIAYHTEFRPCTTEVFVIAKITLWHIQLTKWTMHHPLWAITLLNC